ncbi:hypothetical protein ALC62_04902, partial [Cyphomyrmex costatus]
CMVIIAALTVIVTGVSVKAPEWPPAGCFLRLNSDTQSDIPKEQANPSNCVGSFPISCLKDKVVLLPYRDDCNKFCSYSNGRLIVLSCPPELHFHEAKQVCNWPEITNCP